MAYTREQLKTYVHDNMRIGRTAVNPQAAVKQLLEEREEMQAFLAEAVQIMDRVRAQIKAITEVVSGAKDPIDEATKSIVSNLVGLAAVNNVKELEGHIAKADGFK